MSVRESGGIVYVNFGQRWSEQFTVTILKRNERIFAGAGLTPKALAGRSIEVRGWVEERGGAALEVSRPEQIEILHYEPAATVVLTRAVKHKRWGPATRTGAAAATAIAVAACS